MFTKSLVYKNMYLSWKFLITVIILFLIFPVAPAYSAPQLPVECDLLLQGDSSDSGKLEEFMDRIIPSQMAIFNVPGVTISVVKDGEMIFAKGYGYANVEENIPVVADKTLFRPASVSKLFVWTSVMQLVEQEKLDLDADVNIYLDRFKIPDTFREPITLKHLLTHTAGFEDNALNSNIFALDAASVIPLDDFLAENMPVRVRKPGVLISYSNYGSSLAGYIVQVVSGKPFAEYVRDNILLPLEMFRSTYEQPLPAQFAQNIAVGYQLSVTDLMSPTAKPQPGSFEYLNTYPGGGLSTTATDMAHFMIAHLQNGRYNDTRILKEATALEMHKQQVTFDPRIPGMTFGFHELNRNDLRILWHSGNTIRFYSLLALIPEQNVGLFVSYSSRGGDKARWELFNAFLNYYYPSTSTTAVPVNPDSENLSRYVGTYRTTERSWSTFERFSTLPGEQVTVNPDGTLTVDTFATLDGTPIRWIQVEPLLFREAGGQSLLAFRENERGQIIAMTRDSRTSFTYERQPWFLGRIQQLTLMGTCVVIFLSTSIIWIFSALGALLRKKRRNSDANPYRARTLAGAICLLNLIAFLGFFLGQMDQQTLWYDIPPVMAVSMIVGVLTSIASTGLVIYSALALRNRYWNIAGRIHYIVITIATTAWTWFVYEWNIAGIP